MRYSVTLDRILHSISLLRIGDTKASAAMLAEALDASEFEQDFIDLNELQARAKVATASMEDRDPHDDGDDNDRLLADNSLDSGCAGGGESSWDDVGDDQSHAGSSLGCGRSGAELETAGAGSDNIRRTTMMLRNLRALRN